MLYAPFFVIQKAALLNGESIYATFFWPAFMAKIIAFTFPLFRNTCRKNIYRMLPRINIWFLLLNVIATFSSILGFFFMTNAYAVGLASLVAVTENMQPFCVIFLAWLVAFLVPKCAPRELLTIQSVQVKLVSFLIVFVGLGLLSV